MTIDFRFHAKHFAFFSFKKLHNFKEDIFSTICLYLDSFRKLYTQIQQQQQKKNLYR